MNIALIKPPARGLKDQLAYPPLGLLYIASNITGDHQIKIYNMIKEEEEIEYDADIYGIGIHSVSSVESAKAITKRIKDYTDAPIIWGGAFPTSMPDYSLKYCDYIIKGEGEITFSNMVNYPLSRRHKIREGIQIEALDSLKFPARYLLPKEHIKHEGRVHHADKPSTTVLLTRGCPFSCNFCDRNISSRKWRCRSPENIAEEIKQIINDYDIYWYRFPDDNLTLNRNYFIKLCNILETLDIEWTCLSRSDAIDLEMLDIARNAGLKEIFFGIESGSQELLDKMNKKTTVEANTMAIKLCRKAGIISCAYMMFGFPGENKETVEATKKWLLEAAPDKSRLSTFVPIPGIPVWDNPETFGVRIKNNFEDYWYFDNPETNELYDFGLEYDYIGNDTMHELRKNMINFYRDNKLFEGWTK